MRKAGFSRLSLTNHEKKDKKSTGQSDDHVGNTTSKSPSILRFQNLVSTVTIANNIRRKALQQRQIKIGDLGTFDMSHSTSPEDDDRRPNTTTTDVATIRSDVLSRLNLSDQFRFVTKPNREFQELKVHHIIKEVLEERLQGCEYNAEFCQKISPVIADVIKDRVKKLIFPRYKIICHVLLGQVNGQSMRSVSRCAWNEEFDNFAHYCLQTPTLYAIGVVYGVYAE